MPAAPIDLPIALNLLWLLPGGVGGSEQYTVGQLRGLDLVAPHLRLTLLAQPEFAAACPDLVERHPTLLSASFGASRLRRVAAESTWLRSVTERVAFTHHPGGTAPLRARRPYVLTVHDLQYRQFPHYFSNVKRAWLEAMLPRSVRGAAVVTVPTDFVRTTVIDAWSIEPERVKVVPHGFDPLDPSSPEPTPESVLRERYRLGPGPVLVYPAVTNPHKNHRFLVEMMETHWRHPDLRLVFIGGVGSAEAEAGSSDPRVVRLGRVSDAERDGLLRMAEALVFPSQYEGFGAPLVEAMALGCPVVCADTACLPEVAGDAALVRPLTVDGWAGVLDDVGSRREQLVAAGFARAATFSLANSGAALASVYAGMHGELAS
jgi:alpha-1,3-rhamnosyl/mannosyltransferase